MPDIDAQVENQKRNIGTRSGRPFDDWVALTRASGRAKHGAIVAWLKAEHGFGHGDANLVAIMALRGDAAPAGDDLVSAMYAGPKAALRPFHDRVVTFARNLGDDVELAPKQAYVSLRRAKQFATVGPGPRGLLEIGLNLPGVPPTGRLEAASGMCTHRVRLASQDELDAEVEGWVREAYGRA